MSLSTQPTNLLVAGDRPSAPSANGESLATRLFLLQRDLTHKSASLQSTQGALAHAERTVSKLTAQNEGLQSEVQKAIAEGQHDREHVGLLQASLRGDGSLAAVQQAALLTAKSDLATAQQHAAAVEQNNRMLLAELTAARADSGRRCEALQTELEQRVLEVRASVLLERCAGAGLGRCRNCCC